MLNRRTMIAAVAATAALAAAPALASITPRYKRISKTIFNENRTHRTCAVLAQDGDRYFWTPDLTHPQTIRIEDPARWNNNPHNWLREHGMRFWDDADVSEIDTRLPKTREENNLFHSLPFLPLESV